MPNTKTPDQVDVRGQVQFMSAQLAHAQHHQMLGLAGTPADGGAELGAMAAI